MSKYRYHRGGLNCSESVEFDIVKRGSYVTTCVVSVRMLLCGIKTHPCGNGDDIKLNDSVALEVLTLVKRERDIIKYSGKPKTLVGWRDSGLHLDEYLAVGDEVDEALVDEQMNCVPPRSHKPGYLQVGEVYTDALDDRSEPDRYRPTYTTFHVKNEAGRRYWIYAGHCFTNEDVNRVPEKDVVGGMLRELKKKLGGDNDDA